MSRRAAKPDGPLQVAWELGRAAALRGEPKGACRFRAPARVAYWQRGWLEGECSRVAMSGSMVLDGEEKRRGRAELARLRHAAGLPTPRDDQTTIACRSAAARTPAAR